MIVTCHNCATRLQLDDAKVPSRPFTVRCPKCQQIVNAQSPAAQKNGGALDAVGDLPASTRSQQEMTAPAAAAQRVEFTAEECPAPEAARPDAEADLLRVLTALLRRGAAEGDAEPGVASRRHPLEPRRALVCVGFAHRDNTARALAAGGYDVSRPDDKAQAIERMRSGGTELLVLDSEFDMMDQGAAFVSREVDSMRMSERRRVVFVRLSTSDRTGDAHAAFVNNVNLVVNTADVGSLPRLVEQHLRDLNGLYRDFNKALGVPAL